MNGKILNFHLAGINNQNFIMQDEQTGSYWQQVSGKAISGPMKGAMLELASINELTFELWRTEAPKGSVLQVSGDDTRFYEKDWEDKLKKLPTVLKFEDSSLGNREIVVGVSLNGSDRAFPVRKILEQQVIQDRVGGVPLVLAIGPDNKSVRAFRTGNRELFRKEGEAWRLMDASGSGEWDFRGCSGDNCLEPVPLLKDFWFDWRQYHPNTTVYTR